MSKLFDVPIIVSVCDGDAIKTGGALTISAKFAWVNDSPKKISNAIKLNDTATLNKFYRLNPLRNITDKTRQPTGGGEPDIFRMREISDILSNESEQPERIIRSRSTFQRIARIQYKNKISVIDDIWVFPDDNLTRFKEKIQLATSIPVCRQFLWYETSHSTVSPCFDMIVDGSLIDDHLYNISNSKSVIAGIPVDNNWYDLRSKIEIRSNEHETMLSEIYTNNTSLSWYVLDINDIIGNKKNINDMISTDKYIQDLIYYSFVIRFWPMIEKDIFGLFILNENILASEYSNMYVSNRTLKSMLSRETKLMSRKYFRAIKYKTSVGLTETIVGQISHRSSTGSTVSLLNMFDGLKLNHDMPYVKCRARMGGKSSTIVKTHSSWNAKTKIIYTEINSISIVVRMGTVGYSVMVISETGQFKIVTNWVAQKFVSLTDVPKHMEIHINPVINKINAMGSSIIMYKMGMFSKSNIVILRTSFALTIKKKFTNDDFDALGEIAGEFANAGILRPVSSDYQTKNFKILKGMAFPNKTRFNLTSGLTNDYSIYIRPIAFRKWDNIFNNKTCTITKRSADIMVNIFRVRGIEISNILRYVAILIHNTLELSESPKIKSIIKTKSSNGRLRQLKENDPILFNIKKIYGTDVTYSQICQKPNQPTLSNKAEKGSVKFWNFTNNVPEYYKCESEKFRHLYFKTGVHPGGMCIPCCKKSPVGDETTKLGKIYKQCIISKKHKPESRTVTSSKYIVSYGKPLDVGRLSRLPVKSLEPLLYKQFSDGSSSYDSECITDTGYFLYGTPQTVGLVSGVGASLMISDVMQLTHEEFIDGLVRKIESSKMSIWKTGVMDSIDYNFTKGNDLTNMMKAALLSGSPTPIDKHWNDIIISLTDIFYNIRVIRFVDPGNGQISLYIPAGIKHTKEYFNGSVKYIICISRKTDAFYVINPIYAVDIQNYKMKNIDAMIKSFDITSSAISIIKEVANEKIKLLHGSVIDLEYLTVFADKSKDYDISKLMANEDQMCYAVLMLEKSTKLEIYVAIEFSIYSHLDIPVDTTPFVRSTATGAKSLLKLLDILSITVDSWLMLSGAVIGLSASNKYYWISPIDSVDEAKSLKDVPVVKLFYDPTEVNKAIHSTRNIGMSDAEISSVSGLIYKQYLYDIYLYKFISIVNKSKNNKIRTNLKNAIKNHFTNTSVMVRKVREILSDHPSDFKTMQAIMFNYKNIPSKLHSYNDIVPIQSVKYRAVDLENAINNSVFEFDNVIFPELEKLDMPGLIDRIKSLIPVSYKSKNIQTFDPTVLYCSKNSTLDFCDGESIIMTPSEHDLFVKVLAGWIKNPLKANIIKFYASSGYRTSFTKRANETIFVNV